MIPGKLKEIITCRVCLETFNEHHKCPRMLYCGHSFCHSCIHWLMMKKPTCPTCKTAITFSATTSIPINYALQSLLYIDVPTTVNNGDLVEIDVEENNGQIDSGSQRSSKKRKHESEGYCEEHENYKELRCLDCDMWICAMCGLLIHKHCKTVLVAEAYKELKKQFSRKVKCELLERKGVTEKFTESLKLLDVETKTLIEEIKGKELEIKAKEQELKDRERRIEEIELLKFEETQFCDKLEQLLAAVQVSEDAEFSEAMNELEQFLEQGKKPSPNGVSQIDLPQTREALGALCKTVPVYVMEEHLDGIRYGKVAEKDGSIRVHSFHPGKPDATTLFNFKDLLQQFNGSSDLPKTGFLKLTRDVYDSDEEGEDSEEDSFEVIIQTDEPSTRATNFISLCSALRGISYKGQPIMSGHKNFTQICPGPAPVVEGGIGKDDPKTPRKAADVYGMREDNSWFGIQLKNQPSHSSHKFGVVIQGLQALKDIRGGPYSVTECGLVL